MMTTRFRVAACAIVATLILIGYHAREVAARIIAVQQQLEVVRDVDVTNGIQSTEASVIASEYSKLLLGEMSLCSGTTAPSLVGGVWKSEVLFGFGGDHTGTWISIDPVSGGVTAPGGRAYQHFGSLRREILLNAILHAR